MKVIKKSVLSLLCALLLLGFVIPAVNVEAKAAKLSNTKITVTVGKSKALKLKNNKKKVVWSVASGKKNIVLKKKSRTGVTVVGKKPGNAVVRAKIGNKRYSCKVTVKKAKNMAKSYAVKITVGNRVLKAKLEDNATTRAFIKRMPVTLPMLDLYGREMCYRYGEGTFPTDKLRDDRYKVGDIAYWPPAGSLVILYKQDGEEFERQHLGHIDSGVEIFKSTGDTNVKFELEK